jgi:type VI secretion system protein ImpF
MWSRNDDDRDARRLRASILDRLIDEEPGGQPERPPFRAQTRAEYGRSVARDLNWLLNTRCTARVHADGSPEGKSVLEYGLPDFTHLSPASWEDRQRLAKQVRETIDAFEPRLKVRRVLVEPMEGHHRSLVVRIEALLLGESTPEPVSFRVLVDAAGGSVRVDGR